MEKSRLTYLDRVFVEKVEANRGEFKNKNKIYPMLVDIKAYGTEKWKEQCTDNKLFGIGFIHEVCSKLNLAEQVRLYSDIFRKGTGTKPTISYAKICLSKYL